MDSFDSDYQNTLRREISVMTMEKDKILTSLEAYETTTVKKVDQKSEKLIDYYTKQMAEADAVLERAQQKRDKYVEMCNKEILKLSGGKMLEDPERVTRMRLRLKQIENSVETKTLVLNNCQKVEKKPPRKMTKAEWQSIPLSKKVLEEEKELEKTKGNYLKFGIESSD
jgi:hypothetical protein